MCQPFTVGAVVAHKHATLREKIRAEKADRATKYAAYEALWTRADEAGCAAAEATVPEPMIVHDVLTGHTYAPIDSGVCGFAWVSIRPGNSSFAIWAKKTGRCTTDHYAGGVRLWVGDYGQSYERKYAYARAFADTLRDAGIKAYTSGRLD
jgi:hypothetical protein